MQIHAEQYWTNCVNVYILHSWNFITVTLIVIHKLISVDNSDAILVGILLEFRSNLQNSDQRSRHKLLHELNTYFCYFISIWIFQILLSQIDRLRFYSLRIPFEQAAEFIYWPYLTVSIGQKIFNHSQDQLWDRSHQQTWSLSWLI